MTTKFSALCACLFLAAPAAAQDVVDSLVADLNGDGLRERFTLLHDGDGIADLIVEDTGSGRITVPDMVWIGGIGQEPELGLTAGGSVTVTSMNDAIGRNRWRQTLTLAYRRGGYLVAGYTYSFYDTLNPSDSGSCDLNLLNGRGVVQQGEGKAREIRHDVPARPMTAWNDSTPIPQVCELWQ